MSWKQIGVDDNDATEDQDQIDREIRESGWQATSIGQELAPPDIRRLRAIAVEICRTSEGLRIAARNICGKSETLIDKSKRLRSDAAEARASASALRVKSVKQLSLLRTGIL